MFYTTLQIAKELSVHPNTVRWYEAAGYVSPSVRTAKGHRRFTNGHLVQFKVCRKIFGSPYTGRKLRNAAFAVLTALREEGAACGLSAAAEYGEILEREYEAARETLAVLNDWIESGALRQPRNERIRLDETKSVLKKCTRKEAAKKTGVTTEVLRNWERNGLLNVARSGKKNERLYGDCEILRLRLIYTLRQNNYSIAAIRASLTYYDAGDGENAVLALNRFDAAAQSQVQCNPAASANPEQIFISAGDHWTEVLEGLLKDLDEIKTLLNVSMLES